MFTMLLYIKIDRPPPLAVCQLIMPFVDKKDADPWFLRYNDSRVF